MKSTILSIMLVANMIASCKGPKATTEATETKPAEVVKPSVVEAVKDSTMEELYRLTVTFYSIGSGAEAPLMRNLEDYTGDFSSKNNTNIDFEKSHWGREGESDYCFKLKELTPEKQLEFIAGVKGVLKDGKWFHIYENQPCMHKRKP